MRLLVALAALAASVLPGGVWAEVTQASSQGFVVREEALVAAPPAAVWQVLVTPSRYWNPEHTWFGDSAALVMDLDAACFCERSASGGQQAEHARIVVASPGELLRLRGSLGPLQAEALTGTLSISLASESGGTRVIWEYVVGGYTRFPLDQVTSAVDAVMAEQLSRLAEATLRRPE